MAESKPKTTYTSTGMQRRVDAVLINNNMKENTIQKLSVKTSHI